MSVGLDIGTKTIKIVELSREGNSYSLRSAGAIGNSGPQIEKIQSDKEFGEAAAIIKKLVHDTKLGSKDVAISISENLAFTRILKFPLLNDQEISSAVKWEAEEYIPIPISEAIVEHTILERQEVGSPPQALVLLVAVQRSLVEKYVKVATMAGLRVIGVETELIALTRSLAPPEKTSLVIDFGSRSTDIAVVKNGQVYLARSLSIAGDAFTRAVAQTLGVQAIQAEEYKKTYGLATGQLDGKVAKALSPTFKVVVEEIKKAVHFYQLETKGDLPTSVVLSGGSSGLPGLVPAFAKLLGIEVLIGNPFARVKLDTETSKSLAGYHPLYSVAVGLALRET